MKNRKTQIDILRCVLSILVIAIHTLNINTNAKYIIIIGRIAVPIFFILSGYFIFEKKAEQIKYQIKKLVLIIIIANIIYAIWAIIVNYQGLRNLFWQETLNIKNIIRFLILNQSIYRGHLWYLGALLYCHILYYLQIKYFPKLKKFKLPLIISLLIILVTLCEFLQIKQYLYYRNFIFMGLPYYLIGVWIREHQKEDKHNATKYVIITISCIILNFVEVYVLYKTTTTYLLEHYIMTIAISIGIVLTTSYQTSKYNYKRRNIIAKIGKKCSLSIYIFHVMIIDVLNKLQIITKIPKNQYVLFRINRYIIYYISNRYSTFKRK